MTISISGSKTRNALVSVFEKPNNKRSRALILFIDERIYEERLYFKNLPERRHRELALRKSSHNVDVFTKTGLVVEKLQHGLHIAVTKQVSKQFLALNFLPVEYLQQRRIIKRKSPRRIFRSYERLAGSEQCID